MNLTNLGIIGGADGPTAIFITSDFPMLGLFLLAAAVIVGVIIFFCKKK